MATARNVTVIPATYNPQTRRPLTQVSRRKVAGYARVSTGSDEQFTSYEAQVDYYTNYIQSNAAWDFVKVYTDDGISGTNIRHRDGFNEMITDALAGKIDLIVTKSVSRFARNTVDSLTTVRKLKEKGVEVFFEKENIYTLDSKGELLITIMSSLAQEESHSISENVTWGKRKQFSEGKYSVGYKHFLGYRKGADGLMEIDPEQAVTVRRIYRMYIEGSSPNRIAKTLTAEGIPTPAGKSVWQPAVIISILSNEKYKGDARLQKRFTTDFLTKTTKINEGEVPQYYVTGSHPAIIPPEEWDRVQKEMLRRKSEKAHFSGNCFSGKIICGDCGEAYGPKVWHSNDAYRRVIWQCNAKFKETSAKCSTPHLTEEQIKTAYAKALGILFEERDSLAEDVGLLLQELTDTTVISEKMEKASGELENITDEMRQYIGENASSAIDQKEYTANYESLMARYEKKRQMLDRLQAEKTSRELKADALRNALAELTGSAELSIAFSEVRFTKTVSTVTVHRDGKLTFRFLVGREITVEA